MSIYSVTRRATPDEMGREIDRRGECIERLEAENERLRAALGQIKALPGEINPSNYDHDDVMVLNNSHIKAFQIAEAALTALGEPTSQPMEKVKDGGGYTS